MTGGTGRHSSLTVDPERVREADAGLIVEHGVTRHR